MVAGGVGVIALGVAGGVGVVALGVAGGVGVVAGVSLVGVVAGLSVLRKAITLASSPLSTSRGLKWSPLLANIRGEPLWPSGSNISSGKTVVVVGVLSPDISTMMRGRLRWADKE